MTLHVAFLIHPCIRKSPIWEVTEVDNKTMLLISLSFRSFYSQNAVFKWHGQFMKIYLQGYLCKFHTAEWQNLLARGRCISSMMQRLQSVSQSPLLSLCHSDWKVVSGGWKPILAVLWPTWACIWQCWHVEADLPLQLVGNYEGTQAANDIWRSSGTLVEATRNSTLLGRQQFDTRYMGSHMWQLV
jgi:hypothetical protein